MMADYTNVPPEEMGGAFRMVKEPECDMGEEECFCEQPVTDLKWLPKGLDEGSLAEVVGQSIGRASMCWVRGTGDLQFDDAEAGRVLAGLMAYLVAWAEVERGRAVAAYRAKEAHRG